MSNKRFQASGLVSGILLPMGLICLFAFCSLALSLMGGSAYRTIQDNINEEYDSLVASSYLRTKLSQNNNAGCVELREESGVQLLVITTQMGNATYETRIYVHDGELRESYTTADRAFELGAGNVIAKVDSCEFSISDTGLFRATITTPSGDIGRTTFALAKEGAA